MQGNTLNLHTILTFGVGLKGQILKLCRSKYIFITLSTKIYLSGVCYDLDDTEGELQVYDLQCTCFSQITLRRGIYIRRICLVALMFSEFFTFCIRETPKRV